MPKMPDFGRFLCQIFPAHARKIRELCLSLKLLWLTRSTANVTAETKTLILDFSRAYPDAGFPEHVPGATVLDLSAIEGTVCYCDPVAEAQIKAAIAGRPEVIHWIDSGDYHYVTKLFTDALTEPFTLVLFDNHPDDQAPEFDGVLSCGSWVAAMKEENPLLQEVISVGPDGARPALDVAGKAVWVSVDKDILCPCYARTDWSQGTMTLPQLEEMLGAVLTRSAKVLGVDLCGEFPLHKGGTPEDLRINLQTNLELQQFITNHIN